MMRHLACAIMGLVAATACSDTVAPPPPPELPLYYLKAPDSSGDGQTDTVLGTLPLPFRVLVRRGDTPAPGVTVLWQAGGDTLLGIPGFSRKSVTDARGIATSPFHLTLAWLPGVYAVEASVPGVVSPGPLQIGTDEPCGLALCFTATATPGRPTQLRYVSGDAQTRPINTPLAADYVVRVTDSYGNAISGVVVDWAVTSGGGSITPARDTTTLPDGRASSRLTLGPTAGAQTATATASGIVGAPQVTLTATAVDLGPPADINGIWDWTEQYTTPFSCPDTGSYVLTQTGSTFGGSSQQVGVCYTPTGQRDNTSGPDSLSAGVVAGDSVTFFVPPYCTYYGTVSGNPADHITGTTQCRFTNGSVSTGTWQAVREKPVASVTVTPDSATLPAGDTLRLAAQLRDANGFRLFFRPTTWSSDNPAVASVSAAGLVLGVSAGTAKISATAGGQTGTATVVVP